jgi:hypothetical protein
MLPAPVLVNEKGNARALRKPPPSRAPSRDPGHRFLANDRHAVRRGESHESRMRLHIRDDIDKIRRDFAQHFSASSNTAGTANSAASAPLRRRPIATATHCRTRDFTPGRELVARPKAGADDGESSSFMRKSAQSSRPHSADS